MQRLTACNSVDDNRVVTLTRGAGGGQLPPWFLESKMGWRQADLLDLEACS